ncbi:hypothetical protein QJQ45_023734 [Haematococcus lacustris]|nr:hypothetical protein QJQ45_023734 [Haematococcus lacustris]
MRRVERAAALALFILCACAIEGALQSDTIAIHHTRHHLALHVRHRNRAGRQHLNYINPIFQHEPNLQLSLLGKVCFYSHRSLISSCGILVMTSTLSSQISDTEGSLARTFLSPAHQRAADQVPSEITLTDCIAEHCLLMLQCSSRPPTCTWCLVQLRQWMVDAGMEAWIDLVGNVHGRLNGSDPEAPSLLLGSHYDTVLDGGNFDGALGIIVGIAATKALAIQAALAAGAQLPAPPAYPPANPEGEQGSQAEGGSSWVLPPAAAQAASSRLRGGVRLVAFSDEEGVRFQSTFLGSRAVAGSLIEAGMLAARDSGGATLQQVLQQHSGLDYPILMAAGMEAAAAAAAGQVAAEVDGLALPPASLRGYVEVHMEQGPVLERRQVALGVVSAIAGQTRAWLVINGTQVEYMLSGRTASPQLPLLLLLLYSMLVLVLLNLSSPVSSTLWHSPAALWHAAGLYATGAAAGKSGYTTSYNTRVVNKLAVGLSAWQGHAGTVPMRGRADALAAAAEVVSTVERRCGGGPYLDPNGQGIIPADDSEGLVCSVGDLRVWPGASNVIPGSVQLSLDIRSKSDALRQRVVSNISRSIAEICAVRGVSCSVKRTHDAAAVLCDPGIMQGLEQAIQAVARQPWGGSFTATSSSRLGDDLEGQTCVLSEGQEAEEPAKVEVPVLVSGAGHDAMALAPITKMGMMFVRCRGGVSHSPAEHVAPEDVSVAAAALAHFLVTELLASSR